MQTFSMRPFSTWRTIHDTLIPYIKQVKVSFEFYEIQSITEAFSPDSFADDSPLSSLYLVGYYHEREYLDYHEREYLANKKKQSDSEITNTNTTEQE